MSILYTVERSQISTRAVYIPVTVPCSSFSPLSISERRTPLLSTRLLRLIMFLGITIYHPILTVCNSDREVHVKDIYFVVYIICEWHADSKWSDSTCHANYMSVNSCRLFQRLYLFFIQRFNLPWELLILLEAIKDQVPLVWFSWCECYSSVSLFTIFRFCCICSLSHYIVIFFLV